MRMGEEPAMDPRKAAGEVSAERQRPRPPNLKGKWI